MTTRTADTDAAIRRARDALNCALPADDPRQHLALVSVLSSWLRTWESDVPPAAIEDLAARLEGLSTPATRAAVTAAATRMKGAHR